MATIGLILLVFAFVFACVSARLWTVGSWNMLSVAIAFWIAAEIFGGVTKLGLVH